MPGLQKPEKLVPPSPRLEDLDSITDDLEAARIANEWAAYARSRERAAIEARDARIRAARVRKVSQPAIAAATGLSVAMVRVVCR